MSSSRARGGARLVDVARAAGVSTAAASLALNGKPGVLPEKRERVLSAAQRLGYEANVVGRLLRSARTGTIGVYLPPTALNHDYYIGLLSGIAEALHEEDLSTLVIPNQWGRDHPKLPRAVDGYIVAEPLADDPGVREIMSSGIPVVCGERPPPELPPPAAVVSYDHTELTQDALDDVERAGARHPALVRLGMDVEWADLIESEYRDWCRSHDADPILLTYNPFDDSTRVSNELRSRLSTALQPNVRDLDATAETRIDALVIGADVHAASIASMVGDASVSENDEIVLVSLVDNPHFEMRRPSITAVDLDPKGFGARCAEVVLAVIAEETDADAKDPSSPTVPIIHPHHLIRRDSTRPSR